MKSNLMQFKNENLNNFLEQILQNHLKKINLYKNTLDYFNNRVNNEIQDIKNTIQSIKEYLINKIIYYKEYLKDFQKKTEKLINNNVMIDYEKMNENQPNFKEILNYINFLEKQISFLKKLQDSSNFRLLVGRELDNVHNLKQEFLTPKSVSFLGNKRSLPDNSVCTYRPIYNCSLENTSKSSINNSKQKFDFIQENTNNSKNTNIDKQLSTKLETKELLAKFRQAILPDKLGSYIVPNFMQLFSTTLIYKSHFAMKYPNVNEFNFEFMSHDLYLNEAKKSYENVKVTILKKESKCLSSVIKLMEKFFRYFIRRKDENGNQMFKGVLSCDFETFEKYFTLQYKAFEPIEIIEIEVYLFKYDLFNDYCMNYDKTNLHCYEMNILLDNTKILNKLRSVLNNNMTYK